MSGGGAIRSLVAANAHAANDATHSPTDANLRRWVNTFAPDGVFAVEGVEVRGHEALLAFHRAVMGRGGVPRHFVGESMIEIDGDAATGVAEFLLITGAGLVGSGRYEDRYGRSQGRWTIVHRRATVVGGASPGIVDLARRAAGST